MWVSTLMALAGVAYIPSSYAATGKSYTGWDCCKPGCAWSGNLKGVKGSPNVCDINNNPIKDGLNAASGCSSGGKGYLCDTYVPTPVSDNISYGFATMGGSGNCCKCFQLTWTSGNAKGKQMIVQAVNNFDTSQSGDVKANDIVILTPGGGNGGNDAGCRNQYGTNWGESGGGVSNGKECGNLPQNLQGGCYWRYNWAKGSINAWNIEYQQVSCPSRLTSISGCST